MRQSVWFWFAVAILGGSVAIAASPSDSSPPDNDVSALLQQADDLLAGLDRLEAQVEEVLTSVDQSMADLREIDRRQDEVKEHQTYIQETWTAWNRRQYQDLQRKLKAIVEAEIHRRNHAQDQVDEYKYKKEYIKRQKEQAAAGDKVDRFPPSRGLAWDEVAEILSPEKFIKERDERVGAWIADLIHQTMADRELPKWEWAENIAIATNRSTAAASSGTASPTSGSGGDDTTDNNAEQGCWTLLDAVMHIQEALTNYSHEDGLGVTDHARGGRVVHHATTPTYHPKDALSSETWRNSIWRNYLIPQDVEEYILSHFDGWEDWPLWPTNHLSHSLARLAPSAYATAPPETILQGATWPGACWPMAGYSGQITFVLPYAIHPTAISIDHVSRLLTPDGDRDTAPKTLRVWGYAPCEKWNCKGLEFKEEEMYDLFRGETIKYDLNGSSVQTFWLPPPQSPGCDAPDDEHASAASCIADFSVVDIDTLVRAIKIEVIDNWGNGDYTCLYRARVHGSPST